MNQRANPRREVMAKSKPVDKYFEESDRIVESILRLKSKKQSRKFEKRYPKNFKTGFAQTVVER